MVQYCFFLQNVKKLNEFVSGSHFSLLSKNINGSIWKNVLEQQIFLPIAILV